MALTKAQLVDMNANELILDLDADTSLHASTDDQIDIKIGGADDFRFTANTFTALAGSTITGPTIVGSTSVQTPLIEFTDGDDAMTIADGGVVTFAQAPVFPDGSLAVVDLDIDGATDIGAAVVDADLFIIDDGANGTNRKVTAARVKTYMGAEGGAFSVDNLDIDGSTDIGAAIVDADLFIIDDGAGGTNRKVAASRIKTYIGSSTAADDLTIGDAAVTLSTSSGNITIDATANDSDIIFKGTDNSSDITMLTLDGSADGAAIFKSTVTTTGLIIGSTAVTSTPAELNLIDGGTSRGTTAVADADGLLINDDGTMRMTTAATVKTYMQTGLTSNSILDADSDTKIQVEEGTDEDIIRYDVAGAEVATQTARGFEFTAVGGFVMNQTTNSQTFTIASTENAIVGGPIALSGTITVEGSLAVV